MLEEKMRKTIRFIQGAILGGILGGIAVILLAPGSGEDTRSAVINQFNQLKKQIETVIQQRRSELQEEFERYTKV
jgi:gas vesicle protein